MSRKVHLFRHAEGLHNFHNDPTIHDAPLSAGGFDAAEDLGRRFLEENSNTVGAILSSPLRRTIQTSLAVFPLVLSSAQYPAGSGKGVENGGVTLSLSADLQEISDRFPCNFGSIKSDLEGEFPELATQIQGLPSIWPNKTGSWSPDPAPVVERMDRILQTLWTTSERLRADPEPRTDIAIVTHEGINSKLVPGVEIKQGEYKTFELVKDAAGHFKLQ